MAGFVLSPDADQSLRDILRYTRRRWGREQSLTYLMELKETMEWLARHPLSGSPQEEIASDLRRYPAQKHMIYYLLREDRVYIVNILHQRMDFNRRL